MRKKIIVLCIIIGTFMYGGCVNNMSERNGTSNSTGVRESYVTSNDLIESSESDQNISNTDIKDVLASTKENITRLDINWLSEVSLKELRDSYYGTDTLDLEEIKDIVSLEETKYKYYRKDSSITSCVASNDKYNLGITTTNYTEEVVEFCDIWKEEIDIYALVKQHLFEETFRNAQDAEYFVLVTNYDEVIESMDIHPENWYWHMNTTGIVITFRKQILRSGEFEYLLPYSEWNKYLKEEYLLNVDGLVGKANTNQNIELDNGEYIRIEDDPKALNDVVVKTNSSEYILGDMYGECMQVYFLNKNSEYYLLVETSSMSVFQYGSVLVFRIVDGGIIQCDSIDKAGIESVEGFDNIMLWVLGEGNNEHDYSWKQSQYRLDEDGKFVSVCN